MALGDIHTWWYLLSKILFSIFLKNLSQGQSIFYLSKYTPHSWFLKMSIQKIKKTKINTYINQMDTIHILPSGYKSYNF